MRYLGSTLLQCLLLLSCGWFLIYGLDSIGQPTIVSGLGYLLFLSGIVLLCFHTIKRKFILISNVLILFGLIFLLEVSCWLLLGMPVRQYHEFAEPRLRPGHSGGYFGSLPKENTVSTDIRVHNGDTLYNVTYTIDSLSKCYTPGYNSSRTHYALFFGCSIGFGTGVGDSKTLPACFQQAMPTANSYNYAGQGWGASNTLALLESRDLSQEVQESEGVGIYLLMWSHIRRVIGDMQSYTGWGHNNPYYAIENGSLVRKGDFAHDRMLISWLYESLFNLNIVKYFRLNFPRTIADDHLILTAEVLRHARDQYIKQFDNDNFYVLIHPTNWLDYSNLFKVRFLPMLEERNIKYIDYSHWPITRNYLRIPHDGHPSPAGNLELADSLSQTFNDLLISE